MVAELERLHDQGAAGARRGDQALRLAGGLGERLLAQNGAHLAGARQPLADRGVVRAPGTDDGDVDILPRQHPLQVEVGGGDVGKALPVAVERRLRDVAHGDQMRPLGKCTGRGMGSRDAAGSHQRHAIA